MAQFIFGTFAGLISRQLLYSAVPEMQETCSYSNVEPVFRGGRPERQKIIMMAQSQR